MEQEIQQCSLEELERYSYIEFSLKESLFIEYIARLTRDNNTSVLLGLFQSYVNIFKDTYMQTVERQNAQHPFTIFDPVYVKTSVKLRKLLRLLVLVVVYYEDLPLRALCETLEDHIFLGFVLESAVIHCKKHYNDMGERLEWKKLNMQVKFFIGDLKFCLNLYSNEDQEKILAALEKRIESLSTELTSMLKLQSFYLLIVYYFQNEEYDKVTRIKNKFAEAHAEFTKIINNDTLLKLNDIEMNQLRGIEKLVNKLSNSMSVEKAAGVVLEDQSIKEEDAAMSVEQNAPPLVSHPASKQNDVLQLSEEVFHPSELSTEEKLQAFNHYMRCYYESQDHSFVRAALKAMNSISKEEEESIKNSGSFIEYVFNMLISKFESKKPEELQKIEFREYKEAVVNGIECYGLPSTAKLELLFFCFLKATTIQTDKTKNNIQDIRDLLVFIQNLVLSKFKLTTHSEIQKRIAKLTQEGTDAKKSKDHNGSSLELEEIIISIIVPSLCYELLYLVDAEASEIKSSKLKDLLDLFWTIITFIGCGKNIRLMHFFTEQPLRIWNMKVLHCLMDVTYYIALLFKIYYQNSQPESNLNWDYKILTDQVKILEDHHVFTFLTNNADHLRGAIAFYDFEKDRANLSEVIEVLEKAHLKISREINHQEIQTPAQISKFEFQVQKSLSKLNIDYAKYHIYVGNYNQAMKLIITNLTVMSYSKRNPYERVPDAFAQHMIFELLCVCLWKVRGYNELLVMMQFTGDAEYQNLPRVMPFINDFPSNYTAYIISPILLENLYYKNNNSSNATLLNALNERIKSLDVFQTNFILNNKRSENTAKIDFIRFLNDNYLS